MKVSLNLAQYYSNVDIKGIGVPELLKKIGAQLGAVEEVIDWGPRYDKIVVAKVVSCDDHPNADKLHVCTIDDGGITPDVNRGENGYVQVVCGAPNVRAGMLVAWIPPGATVPSTQGKDPFVLEARELRGIVSNGMLASSHELGINDDHSGLLEIKTDDVGVGEDNAKPGTPFKNLYNLNDVVIDCENKMFTHRPDCFGVLGVTRELAGIQGLAFKSPDWYMNVPEFESKSDLPFDIRVETDTVSRFMAVAMKNVEVHSSPIWVQAALTRVGIRPINNIVDVTNFVMYVTGQPLHAFDYDKLKAYSSGDVVLGPRAAKKGEKLALLNGKEVELTENDIVIATDKQAVALAGVMGGAETEVDENTKNIVIECATFDMYTVRRTSMHHGLFTDAVTRYSKGQSPLQNDRVLAYAMGLMAGNAAAEQASDVKDVMKPRSSEEMAVPRFEAKYVNDRLGSELSIEHIKQLLENVEFAFPGVDGQGLLVEPPFWRTDIEMPEDIVEEVGRLYGYDKLPINLPPRTAKPTVKNPLLSLKGILRTELEAAGASEVLSYSFVHGDLMRRTGIDPDKWAFHLRNAISPDLQYYRTSLIPSLLDKVYSNLRSDMVRSDDNEFALFEFGKAHVKDHNDEENLPQEMERLAFVFAADAKTAARKYSGSALYMAKHYLLPLKTGTIEFEPLDNNDYPITAPYQIGRSAVMKINGEVFGVVGEFRPSVKQALKLPDFTAGYEIDLSIMQKHLPERAYLPISQFPKTQQDITLEVAHNTPFSNIHQLLANALESAAEQHGYVSVIRPRDIFQEDGSDKKRLTFRIWLSHSERTLTTDETNMLLDSVAERAASDIGARRV